jgi:hypothetical protein
LADCGVRAIVNLNGAVGGGLGNVQERHVVLERSPVVVGVVVNLRNLPHLADFWVGHIVRVPVHEQRDAAGIHTHTRTQKRT